MNVYLRSLDDQLQFQIQEGQTLLLGRLDQCDLVLEDGSVSSQHARLNLSEGVLVLADLGSTNGTRVNYSVLVEPMALMDGDTVEFGNVSFIVDGPGLRTERKAVTDSAFINEFKPLDLSSPLEATMQLSGFTDQDLEDEADDRPEDGDSAVETDLEAVVSLGHKDADRDAKVQDAPSEAAAGPADSEFGDVYEEDGRPVGAMGRVLATCVLFGVFTGLMGLYLWQFVPTP